MERFAGFLQGLVIYEYLNVSRRLTPEFVLSSNKFQN